MPAPDRLSDFPVHVPATTRWSDNDMYGHLNNAVYYELFDTAINAWVDEATGTAALAQPAIGVVAESSCRFLAELAFPTPLVVGLRIERLGTKSVTYALGLFDGDAAERGEPAAALGRWVHVYLDPATRATVPIPPAIRTALESIAPQDDVERG